MTYFLFKKQVNKSNFINIVRCRNFCARILWDLALASPAPTPLTSA